jgi:hypothetical protein
LGLEGVSFCSIVFTVNGPLDRREDVGVPQSFLALY